MIPDEIKRLLDASLPDVMVSNKRKKIGRLRSPKPIKYAAERTDLETRFVASRMYYSTKTMYKTGKAKPIIMFKGYTQDEDGTIRHWQPRW